MSTMVTTRNGGRAQRNSNGLTVPRWSTFIDEMFNRDLGSVFTSGFNQGMTLPKVNIRETQDAYYVDMAVSGMKKSDFHIDLDNQVLSISTEMEEERDHEGDNYVRREFGYANFKRSFVLPDTVNEEEIKAEYTEGILSVNLPKKEEAKQKPAKSIKIS